MVLEAYSRNISAFASFATIPLLLSPSIICREFIKKGSADHVRPFIFVSGIIRSVVFLQFGIVSQLKALVRIHSFGLALYVIYSVLYYNYCKDKKPLQNSFGKAIAFLSLLLGYVNFRPDSFIAIYFEHIATLVHLSLLAMPLTNLKNVIRTKSTAGMPFPIIFCAHLVSVLWLFFGFSVNNKILISQMLIGSIITGIQLSLFIIYPSKSSVAVREKANSSKKRY